MASKGKTTQGKTKKMWDWHESRTLRARHGNQAWMYRSRSGKTVEVFVSNGEVTLSATVPFSSPVRKGRK